MRKIFLVAVVLSSRLFAQEADISEALKWIENGNSKEAVKILQSLKSENMNDPSVIYLDALLTTDGEEALRKYSAIVEKYPESKYADAALYNIFSYYYSLGYYKKAESYLERLKKDFPESPYIKMADRKIPDTEEAQPQTKEKTEIAPQPETKSEKAEPANYNFTIQAGAFLNPDNAKKLSEQFQKEKFSVEITTKEVGGTILNVVNVGKFATEEEAKSVLDLLAGKFSIKGRIVEVKR